MYNILFYKIIFSGITAKKNLYKRKEKNEKKKIHKKEECTKGQKQKTSKIEPSEQGIIHIALRNNFLFFFKHSYSE